MKNLPLSLTVSAISGAFALLRPADWSPRVRRASVVVPGALAGAGLAAVLFRSDGDKQAGSGSGKVADDGGTAGSDSSRADTGSLFAQPPAVRALAAAGAGAVVSGIQVLSLRLDERLERWLLRHRVPAPRYWMALAVALTSLAVDLVHDREDGSRFPKLPKPGAEGIG